MRIAAVLVVVIAGCSSGKRGQAQPRPELIETVRVLADSACACATDKECLRTVRADWDAQKADLLQHGLTGDQAAAFDAEVLRLRHCGDKGGLTFWVPPPAP